MFRVFTLTTCFLLLFSMSASAEFCHSFGGGQFANDTSYCVSSVLGDQGNNAYGPAGAGDGDPATAWCEGVPGRGENQWIEVRYSEPQTFKTLWVENGYNKSQAAWSDNGRLFKVRVETSDGLILDYTLLDQPGSQPIYLPREVTTTYVRLTILDTYPGAKYEDTCLDGLWPDLEELNYSY